MLAIAGFVAFCYVTGLNFAGSSSGSAEHASSYMQFKAERRVSIHGYFGDAMEPFISKDGRYLLFNNLNQKPTNTNLYYATRIDEVNFQFQGEIRGVNTDALEGVPSLDRNDELYFISDRSYSKTLSTVYCAHWLGGDVGGVEVVSGISQLEPGLVNFDAEISGDGNTLYFVDGDFRSPTPPLSAAIAIAERSRGVFSRDPQSSFILNHVNRGGLNYAPSISSNGLELFFTRIDPTVLKPCPAIYRATRKTASSVFTVPQVVGTITGFVEGPTLTDDGKSLYYHKRVDGRYIICCETR